MSVVESGLKVDLRYKCPVIASLYAAIFVYNMSHEYRNFFYKAITALKKMHIKESKGKTNFLSQKRQELYCVTLRLLETESLSTLQRIGDAPSGTTSLFRNYLLSFPTPLIPTYKVNISTMFCKRKLCE